MDNRGAMFISELLNKVRIASPTQDLAGQYTENVSHWYEDAVQRAGETLYIGFKVDGDKVLCQLFNKDMFRYPGEMRYEVEENRQHIIAKTIKSQSMKFTNGSFIEEEELARREERSETSIADMVANARNNADKPKTVSKTMNVDLAIREVGRQLRELDLLNVLNRAKTPRTQRIVDVMGMIKSIYHPIYVSESTAEVRITYDDNRAEGPSKHWRLEIIKDGVTEMAFELFFE